MDVHVLMNQEFAKLKIVNEFLYSAKFKIGKTANSGFKQPNLLLSIIIIVVYKWLLLEKGLFKQVF